MLRSSSFLLIDILWNKAVGSALVEIVTYLIANKIKNKDFFFNF